MQRQATYGGPTTLGGPARPKCHPEKIPLLCMPLSRPQGLQRCPASGVFESARKRLQPEDPQTRSACGLWSPAPGLWGRSTGVKDGLQPVMVLWAPPLPVSSICLPLRAPKLGMLTRPGAVSHGPIVRLSKHRIPDFDSSSRTSAWGQRIVPTSSRMAAHSLLRYSVRAAGATK